MPPGNYMSASSDQSNTDVIPPGSDDKSASSDRSNTVLMPPESDDKSTRSYASMK